MTMLIDIRNKGWMSNAEFGNAMHGNIPKERMRFYPQTGNAGDILMLACDSLRSGLLKRLPNLKLIQKLGAGVETIVYDPDIPENIRVTRLKPQSVAIEMARFCLAYVLQDIHNINFHRENQSQKLWLPKEPVQPSHTTVGVFGLGHIGGTTAKIFSSLEFRVLGWSRSEKSIDGVECRWGMNELDSVLGESDYAVCVLPSTTDTIKLFDRERFNSMKPGSTLINVGRGSLIVERDLIDALDNNCLAHAVLDVFQNEPLSCDDPLWTHSRVTVTPHSSGWHLDDLSVVADNYNALVNDLPLIHEVSRQSGY